MHELAPNIFWIPPEHSTDRPVLAAIAGDDATLMVDAGASVKHARQFLEALAPRSLPPVRYVVLTHSHWDHVFGAAAFDAPLIASAETRDHLATMATYAWSDAAIDERVATGLEIPFCRDMMMAELSEEERAELVIRVPEDIVKGVRGIDLGNRAVEVLHVGGDHASDSSIVVVPGVAAFLGDCVYHNLHVEPNYRTRRRLFPLLDRLLALDVAHYVLGHHDAPLTREEFVSLADALRTAGEAVEKHGFDDGAIECAPEAAPIVTLFQAGLAHESDDEFSDRA